MANVFSLCNDIEQFLQQSDKNSINQFLTWLKSRLNISNYSNTRKSECFPKENTEKSMINTSQIFFCQCGHRYSFRFAIDDLTDTNDSYENEKQWPTNSSRLQSSSKCFLCNHCQIRLHTYETLLSHHSMHEKGYTFCKRCFQFYNNDQTKSHDCEQRKIDELQSLEQLIPPDTVEQQQNSNSINYIKEHETFSTTAATRCGLPKLTDSIVEIVHSDGKRQYRCPLCFNSYVNRSGLNRHYITHSSQDIWKVECQFCGKRYSRKDSLKHHMKTQHAEFFMSNCTWKDKNNSSYHRSNELIYQSNTNKLSSNLLGIQSNSSSSNEKEQMENDDIVLVN